MKKFLFIYIFILSLLFISFYWETSPIANIINPWQIELSSILTSLLLDNNMIVNNRIFINQHFTLLITKECNGFVPYFFFLASIIAFPSTIKHKIKWAILGYLLLSILNVFRIWFITQFVIHSQSSFSLAHDYLGNLFLVFSGLILFISFIRTR